MVMGKSKRGFELKKKSAAQALEIIPT